MNIKELLVLLLADEEQNSSRTSLVENYDFISEFRKLRDSSTLYRHVLDEFENKILKKVKDLSDDNPVTIDVEINENSYSIKKDGREVLKERKTDLRLVFCNIKDQLLGLSCPENTIYSFKVGQDIKDDKFKEEILKLFKDIKRQIFKSLLICKIDKKRMFKDIAVHGYCYFLSHKNENYSIWFRNRNEVKIYTDDPILFFMFEKIKLEKPIVGSLGTYDEFLGSKKFFMSKKDYLIYAFAELFENVDFDIFFKKNFLELDLESFPKYLKVLSKNSDFDSLWSCYVKDIDENTRNEFFVAAKYYCFNYKQNCSASSHKESQVYKLCNLVESKVNDKQRENLNDHDPILLSLKSFFEYLFKNHAEVINKCKQELLEVMISAVYTKLDLQLTFFSRKMFYIIFLYNIVKEMEQGLISLSHDKKIILDELNKKIQDIVSEKDYANIQYYLSDEEKSNIYVAVK